MTVSDTTGSRKAPAAALAVIPPVSNADFADPDWIAPFAREAERLGFESLVLPEHVVLAVDYTSRYPYSKSGRVPLPHDCVIPDPLDTLAYVAGRHDHPRSRDRAARAAAAQPARPGQAGGHRGPAVRGPSSVSASVSDGCARSSRRGASTSPAGAHGPTRRSTPCARCGVPIRSRARTSRAGTSPSAACSPFRDPPVEVASPLRWAGHRLGSHPPCRAARGRMAVPRTQGRSPGGRVAPPRRGGGGGRARSRSHRRDPERCDHGGLRRSHHPRTGGVLWARGGWCSTSAPPPWPEALDELRQVAGRAELTAPR